MVKKKKEKKNHLLEKVTDIFKREETGKVLDLGCGNGDYSQRLSSLGFDVTATDLDTERFRYQDNFKFRACDITKGLPFDNESFDYILLLEVVEHLKNPYFVFSEILRVLKKDGVFILSTPNILNIKSRLRYLAEGAYEFFREPPLDQLQNPKEKVFNLHIAPYRYHELEYLLGATGFKIKQIFTSVYEDQLLGIFWPFIKLQAFFKQNRALKKGGLDYSRIHKVLLSRELLFGRHLILKAIKNV